MATPTTNPENMLPIMIVLGVMFIGICIAMNLFSRARFKKRTNAFATARANTPSRRSHRGSSGGPGNCQRSDTQTLSRSVSPMQSGRNSQQATAKQYQMPSLDSTSPNIHENRVSLDRV